MKIITAKLFKRKSLNKSWNKFSTQTLVLTQIEFTHKVAPKLVSRDSKQHKSCKADKSVIRIYINSSSQFKMFLFLLQKILFSIRFIKDFLFSIFPIVAYFCGRHCYRNIDWYKAHLHPFSNHWCKNRTLMEGITFYFFQKHFCF